MHILKSYKYVYDPFQVSLWALLIIIMTFHLLFILLFWLFFCLSFIIKSSSLDIDPLNCTLHRFTLLLIEKVTFCIHLLILNAIFMACSLNRLSLGECIDLQILSIKISPIFRFKSPLRVYLVGQSRPYRAPFLGLLVVWLRFAYFLELVPD